MTPWPAEARSLLDILRASPEDVDTWRVFADWLADRGDARGELIQLEQRVSREEGSEEEQIALLLQIDELKRAHEPSWLEGLFLPERFAFKWSYGFIVGAWTSWNADTLPFLAALRAHPVGVLLHSLRLHFNNLGDEGVRALVTSDHLRGLQLLDLTQNNFGVEGASAIAAAEHLHDLTELSLSKNDIGDEGAKMLADAEHLRALRVLDLYESDIRDEGAKAIAASGLCALTMLDLSNNLIEEEGACALLGSENLRSLRTLNLHNNPIRTDSEATLLSLLPRGCKLYLRSKDAPMVR